MGIRNKVNSAGWISENIGGTSVEVDLGNAKQTSAPILGVQTVVSGNSTEARTASSPVVIIAGAQNHATASLPVITTANVGKTFFVVATGSNPTLLSASNPINFGSWSRTISNSNLITCVATNTDFGFSWLASSGSAL